MVLLRLRNFIYWMCLYSSFLPSPLACLMILLLIFRLAIMLSTHLVCLLVNCIIMLTCWIRFPIPSCLIVLFTSNENLFCTNYLHYFACSCDFWIATSKVDPNSLLLFLLMIQHPPPSFLHRTPISPLDDLEMPVFAHTAMIISSIPPVPVEHTTIPACYPFSLNVYSSSLLLPSSLESQSSSRLVQLIPPWLQN